MLKRKFFYWLTISNFLYIIIVLLILAGVSIATLVGNNGLLTKANEAKEANSKAEVRERLTLVLSDIYIEKKTNAEYNESDLDSYIYEREPEADVNGEEISLNGHTFKLNRDIPELGDYVGPSGELPARISNIEYTVEDDARTINVTVSTVRLEKVKNPQYKYYIKEENGEYQLKDTIAENTYMFDDLEEENYIINYIIKVELIGEATEGNPEGFMTSSETSIISLNIPYYQVVVPQISEGMTPIKWNGSNWIKTTANDEEWYNYEEKEWANVVLGDAKFTISGSEEILDETNPYSMLVWIPRYAYQIKIRISNNQSISSKWNRSRKYKYSICRYK